MSAAFWSDFHVIRLLQIQPLERAPRGGWRFGLRRVSDGVAQRLIASGRAEVVEGRLRLRSAEGAE